MRCIRLDEIHTYVHHAKIVLPKDANANKQYINETSLHESTNITEFSREYIILSEVLIKTQNFTSKPK